MFELRAQYSLPHATTLQILAGTFISYIIWICFKKLRLAFNQDLRKIPGPYLSTLTVWPLKVAVLSGRRTLYIHELHKKYGPFVRISPSEVAIADFSAWRQIHRIGSDFRKNPAWYQGQSPFQYDDNTCGVFNLNDPKKASARRKLFLTANVRSIVVEWEPQVVQLIDLTMQKMKRDLTEDGECDVMKWWTLQAADVAAGLAFGGGFSNVAQGEKSQMIEDIEAGMPLVGLRLELPLIYDVFMLLPLPASRKFKDLWKRYTIYGKQAVTNTKNASKSSTKTLFSKMLPEDGTEPLTETVVEQEAANIFIAGIDTIAMTLIYLTYAVLKDEIIRQKLVKEVQNAPASPTWEQLEDLTYLHNVIRETWRRYPAIPASLPRVVPAGGAKFGEYSIPEGSIVSTQAYTFHLDPTTFSDPLRFDPDRWLNATSEMKERMMVFGGPVRQCVGQNIAKLQLFHSVFRFFREYGQMKLAPGTNDESMTMVDYFAIKPVAGKCMIVPT